VRKVDLVVPGLLNLPAHEINTEGLIESTPCLHRLLRFATRIPNTAYDIDNILIHRLGLKQSALPYAYAHNPVEQVAQVMFKPVYLKSDMNNAIVYPVDDFNGDIAILINDLSDYFKEDCSVKLLPDNSWLMTLNGCIPPTSMPHYLTATGKKVTHYLQQAKANLEWFRLFNEMQMYLFQHDINQKRTDAGLPTINSLWCWGADDYAGEVIQQTVWFSDDVQMQEIGRLYCNESADLTALDEHKDKDAIIVDLSFLKALKGDWNLDVFELLLKLEKNCLQPLLQLDSVQLCLHTGGEFNFHYKTWMKWKLWRRDTYSLIK
jgi:hypothetical protein